jgi:hypothetical protein
MSNGIASGVPPADGGAGGPPGDGVGDCAKAKELVSAMAQVARAKETIERIRFSRLKFSGLLSLSVQRTHAVIQQPQPYRNIPAWRKTHGAIRF